MKSLRRVKRTPGPGNRPEPSLKVVRAAAVLGVVVPVYGLLRLLTGLFHWILPARILSAIPELVSDVHNAHAIASGVILFFLGLRLLRRQRFSYYASLLVLTASAISGLIIFLGITSGLLLSGLYIRSSIRRRHLTA